MTRKIDASKGSKSDTNIVKEDWETIVLMLDKDMINWLKSGGKGYQSRANAILRNAMQEDLLADQPPS